MKFRTGVALVGLAGVGVAAVVGYGLLRQVAPIFHARRVHRHRRRAARSTLDPSRPRTPR